MPRLLKSTLNSLHCIRKAGLDWSSSPKHYQGRYSVFNMFPFSKASGVVFTAPCVSGRPCHVYQSPHSKHFIRKAGIGWVSYLKQHPSRYLVKRRHNQNLGQGPKTFVNSSSVLISDPSKFTDKCSESTKNLCSQSVIDVPVPIVHLAQIRIFHGSLIYFFKKWKQYCQCHWLQA